jgi:hypothetical protein
MAPVAVCFFFSLDAAPIAAPRAAALIAAAATTLPEGFFAELALGEVAGALVDVGFDTAAKGLDGFAVALLLLLAVTLPADFSPAFFAGAFVLLAEVLERPLDFAEAAGGLAELDFLAGVECLLDFAGDFEVFFAGFAMGAIPLIHVVPAAAQLPAGCLWYVREVKDSYEQLSCEQPLFGKVSTELPGWGDQRT